ncbi:MAG TPA: pyridoxamine 5'-phosphate oxidase [Gammaproteobacteria bacterium]|nr:pyridoxamine 5'-phosphate oxidase [Gammaproteobacteria bacterium]|tara:strand:+ start:331 stop:987 length:657 start_codon:yes stop_codon:yes gene_type:complete
MSDLYADSHRELQDQFDTRRLADCLEEMIVADAISKDDRFFIESREFFFLSTVNPDGQPTVSFKGGPVGFVKVVNESTIAFPSYDGNGMFYSIGNLAVKPEIGILFIDFEKPHRVRFHGRASIQDNDPLLGEYKEADLVVRVQLSKMWINCPRYIPKLVKVESSRYLPKPGRETPLAGWKRIDAVQDALPKKDVGRPEREGGVITMDQWTTLKQKGEG